MKTIEKTMRSREDGLMLSVIETVPESVLGVVQIVHGMAEHKERYLPFMKFLYEHHIACIVHDHRGHGKSVKNREDLGYFYDASANAIVEDVKTVGEDIRNQYFNVPFILFGHSMGSLVVRNYLKKYDNTLDALIVCGPPAENKLVNIALTLVALLTKIHGDRYQSKLIQWLSTGSFGKGNTWLSKNEKNIEEYNADPECGFCFTLNGFKNLFTLLKRTYDPKGWKKSNLNLPILFIAGEDDPVIVSKKAFYQEIGFLNKIGYSNIQNYLFSSLRHEILNEVECQNVYDIVLDFIKKK